MDAPPTGAAPPPVVGRLAPSPTGDLHVGHARSFLLAWWSARSQGGRVVLRVEDLDRERVRPGASDALLADLEWLGLDWDGEPLFQSRDEERLRAAARELLERGLAFPCTCTRREIALSAPHATDGEVRYPGTCRERWTGARERERALAAGAGVRLRVDPGAVELVDGFAGPFRCDPGAEVGDFLVQRRDGAVAYQLAVSVHDAHQGVTEVLRGRDLLPSAARQWLVQERLGLPHPRWLHVPLVVDAGGNRLAKRSGGASLRSLRERGADPRALVAWVARSAGMDAAERASARELVPAFALPRVPRGDVAFGPEDEARVLAPAPPAT